MTEPLKVKVEIEPAPIQFQDALKELSVQGKRFYGKILRRIPYSQLHLCCIGSAGQASCDPRLVRQEKNRRIARFILLAPEELTEVARWLMAEGMYNDVIAEAVAKTAPSWNDLKPKHQVVAKLFCIYNHTDDPEERIIDAMNLLKLSAGDGVDPMTCSEISSKLFYLVRKFRGIGVEEKDRMGDQEFRAGIWRAMEVILDLFPVEEQAVLLRERLRDFGCTSDCFRSG